MYYYMTKYSFASTKEVFGPFKTAEEAYTNMEKDADNEYNIDTNENGFETEIYKDTDSGEITIVNYFGTNKDVTEFFIFEI